MMKAWERKSRELFREDLDPALIRGITTRVLSTRYPAYSIKGGVFDALGATGGVMYGVRNKDVYEAMDTFEKYEGIDIVPAAGVAVAALKDAIERGEIATKDVVLLNITGGGQRRVWKERETYEVVPHVISRSIDDKGIEELVCKVLKKV